MIFKKRMIKWGMRLSLLYVILTMLTFFISNSFGESVSFGTPLNLPSNSPISILAIFVALLSLPGIMLSFIIFSISPKNTPFYLILITNAIFYFLVGVLLSRIFKPKKKVKIKDEEE